MSAKRLLECVPNFSEGRNMDVINEITKEIESVSGVKLLDVDPGKATNRTVVTFVGKPEAVIEAAFLAMRKASEVIDMSVHSGEHPRMGATDVCPMIPISGISMEEAVKYANLLAERAGRELGFPIFMYEEAATKTDRKNLATIRAGEYEGLADKLKDSHWKPDYGPAMFNSRAGATVIGARDFLVAYNINLNTSSVRRANSVAFDVRENGRIKREGGKLNGKILKDKRGNPLRKPGKCKSVKAIGWYIDEYKIAQISMNLTNINVTPLHLAFEECRKSANARGLRITGSELVGLVPKSVLVDAGKYFLRLQQRSVGVSEQELIHIAIKSLGLDELAPFEPKKKIIEYLLEENKNNALVDMSLTGFANEAASDTPAPGGGSVSAYVGALGAALGAMVANLSAHKRGWDDRWEEFSVHAEQGQKIKDRLLTLVDEDTAAFNKILAAIRMPKKSPEEKRQRDEAMADATREAISVPLEVMSVAFDGFSFVKEMAKRGNPNSVSDAGVGALCLMTAIEGAHLNVKINCAGFDDIKFVSKVLSSSEKIIKRSRKIKDEVIKLVEKQM